jgi:methylenetetrahydrofolate dehydrogenase (NADP+)/methenyltetrahydrofolate cyclohydrolase
MTATIIDGNAIAQTISTELAVEIAALKAQGITPGLATVLVGDNPASQTYVRMKGRRCAKLGMHSVAPTLPQDATQEQVEAAGARA